MLAALADMLAALANVFAACCLVQLPCWHNSGPTSLMVNILEELRSQADVLGFELFGHILRAALAGLLAACCNACLMSLLQMPCCLKSGFTSIKTMA